MPTMSADVQAVLATDKVRFQGQEVAFVVADDRYSRARRAGADRRRVRAAAGGRRRAPRARARRAGHPRRRADGSATTSSTGRRATRRRPTRCSRATTWSSSSRRCSSRARTRRRWRPAARWRTFDRVAGKLTVWCTTQAPHAHRTLYSLDHRAARAPHPGDLARRRRRVRQQGPGLSRLRLRDRRGAAARAPGQVDGGPLGEPDVDRVRARLRDAGADRRDARRASCSRSPSTSSPTTARSTPPRSRRATRRGSSASSPAPTTSRPRTAPSPASTPTRRRAGWRTRARSGSPRRSTWSSAASTAWRASWGSTRSTLRLANLIRPDQFPYASKTGWVYDSRQLRGGAAQGAGARGLPTRCGRAGGEARARAS